MPGLILLSMKKVIIAEDIKPLLDNDQSFLNRSDIKIFTAATNQEALALHTTEKADLIIAQLDTPEMNSETLSSLIRNDRTLFRVSIIIVCSDSEDDARRCLQCRANTFISSPIDKEILLQEMQQLLYVAPRSSLRIPLGIQFQLSSKESPFTGYAENISASGMLLHSETLLFEGEAITSSFYLPDSTHIVTNAEVVRILEKVAENDPNGYGIKFIDLSTDFHSAIKAFVEKERKHR